MTGRMVFYAAALAAVGAIVVAAPMLSGAQAQDVKEQWDISAPQPGTAAKTDAAEKPAAAAGATTGGTGTAIEGAVGGKNEHGLEILKNPYTGNAAAIAEGKELFVTKACSGCHGAGGGGGMCPPVINSIWVYGNDDTTLFNLIKLGSVGLRATGYSRIGHEKVVGDMPAFASFLTPDQEWHLLAYVRSRYSGD